MTRKVEYRQLRDAMLFKELSNEVLVELAQRCRYMELHADETLFQQGDPGDALYILQDGQIHIVRKYPTGDEVILATEGPYYVIGELSMLADQPRTGGAVAVSDCTLIALDRHDFVSVCAQMPSLATSVMATLALRFYRMNLLVREHAIGNVAARVASVLLLLSGGKTGQVMTDIRVSRVARAAAIDADAVERLFQQWARLGYIDFEGSRLTIHNLEVIHNIAG